LIFSDCRCRKHDPIVIDEPAPVLAAPDLAVAAVADLASVAVAPVAADLAGLRTDPPSEADVRAALKPVLDGIARCVSRALPPLDARLTLRFKLDPSGKLTDAQVEGMTGADACVQQMLDAVLTPTFTGEPAKVAIPLGHDGRPIAGPVPAQAVSDGGG
jgi:hypothetical protein